jgi:predicted ATPase
MAGTSPVIRTPDQRLRVFVSSTLRELADERRVVRAAIERMRLAPVMFELGARPHPPRDLYRAYLAQSDVFIGIYGDSYGWIAPGEEISGLEDEYRLAPRAIPKLIYIRETDTREERLTALIARIRADDTAAYLPFRTAEQLGEQVAGDLATLLAERFDQSRRPEADAEDRDAAASATLTGRVPVPYTTTIGREHDIAAVRGLLEGGADRVVSLIGPGGVGKSRLAIEVARACTDLFPAGVRFVPLESVLDPELLLPAIAYRLGVRDTGEAELEERIARSLTQRRMLIVLDNFEQIVDAAPVLVRLFTIAPAATFLVTSRVVLRIRGERVYEVSALTTPASELQVGLEAAARSPAVKLFVDRARAVTPRFEMTAANVGAIVAVCRRLEGLPLAIELAAAKVPVLNPSGIAERLAQSLPLLTATGRDLPERHRTMSATIEWSVSLLPPAQRDLLEDLGVFAGRFGLDAVEAVGADRSWGDAAVDALAALVDASLVNRVEVGDRAVFSLLVVVREYALEGLRSRGGLEAMRQAHADHYTALTRRIASELRGAGQIEAVAQLGFALPNLRAAAQHLVDAGRLDEAADFARSLFLYWWISGLFAEVRLWMLGLLASRQPMSQRTRATALFLTLWGGLWRHPPGEIISGLGECISLLEEAGDEESAVMILAIRGSTRLQLADPDLTLAEKEMREAADKMRATGDHWAEAMTHIGLGLLALVRGSPDEAMTQLERAGAIGETQQDAFTRVVAGQQRARLLIMRGELDDAERVYAQTLPLAVRLHFDEGVAFALEGACAIAVARGDARRAGALAAAAASIRQRIGGFDLGAFAVRLPSLAALRETDPDGVAAGERDGAQMPVGEAVGLALPDGIRAEIDDLLGRW